MALSKVIRTLFRFILFLHKTSIYLLFLTSLTVDGQRTSGRDPERIVNITSIQAGSRHYRNGNPGLEANFALFEKLARQAATSEPKPDLICFPEYTISGWSYPPENVINGIAESVPGNGYWYSRYVRLARETGVPLLGWIVEKSEGKLYNTSFMLDKEGRYIGKYRKVQANLGEQTWWGWSQGEQFHILELDGVKYGVSICADMWFPETVRCEELLGADVILHVSIADDMGHLIPARAFDSKLPIVATIFQGGSYAVDHQGNMLGKMKPDESGWRTFQIRPFIEHLGNKYGGVWDTKKGGHNNRNTEAYPILTDPATRPPWTEIFMDRNGNPQTRDQLLKRFNGRYDVKDPETYGKPAKHPGSVTKWECIEIEFTGPVSSATGDPNPFDIQADVVFTSPSDKEYVMPGFYDGDGKGGPDGSVWKVRFSADETGIWKFSLKSSNRILDSVTGSFVVTPVPENAPDFYKWGRLEAVSTASDNIMYLKFREGPYWMKAGCDDPENFLGNTQNYDSNKRRKEAVDYLSAKGINSLYIITNNIDGDSRDVWPWLGKTENEARANGGQSSRFDIARLEEWRDLFDYMQEKGIVVYIVLEDDSAWKEYDHARYYREMIARFSYLPGLIFNFNEEHNENYSRPEALEMMALLKKTDPFDHPVGIHNINQPDDDYIRAAHIDFTSIQTGTAGSKAAPGPAEYNRLVTSWISRCKDLSSRTLMIGIDEGRPEEDRRIWWSTYLSGGVWEAHVLGPYDRPMNAWDTIWTELGGTRKFMESIPFWVMHPDSSVIREGKAFCLNHEDCVYALYLPNGGPVKLNLPKGQNYTAEWWNPANGNDGHFQNASVIKGGMRTLTPPSSGDWALRITSTGQVKKETTEVPLYELFEDDLNFPGVKGNMFTKFVSYTFTRGIRTFKADGFYDGNDTWRIRFMPDEQGIWRYEWSFEGKNGGGSFICSERKRIINHGHVKRDPVYPRYLVYDDGTPHYWHGGKWISTSDYGPESKEDETNNDYLEDHQFLSYLDTLERYRHNGLLLKTALFPLENDKLSWDLEWIHRGEWLVREMAARGIYCQINFFDTWSRDREKWFANNTDGTKQVFNVWEPGDEPAKENYLRTLIARYSGFYNVYWELGNELEHKPNKGTDLATQANEKYIPWIRKHDPYDLPVCLSEEVWRKADVDIGLIHQTNRFPDFITDRNRPNMINELVRGGIRDVLWKDTVMRDPSERFAYRRTFWRYFTYGGCGSTEATWLNITEPLNEAVLNVMGDQMRLRNFLEILPPDINKMDTDTSFIEEGPGSFRTRRKTGECYVTYFLVEPNTTVDEGTLRVDLPQGDYEYRWYDPKTGIFTRPERVSSQRLPFRIHHPGFTEDMVLLVTKW